MMYAAEEAELSGRGGADSRHDNRYDDEDDSSSMSSDDINDDDDDDDDVSQQPQQPAAKTSLRDLEWDDSTLSY